MKRLSYIIAMIFLFSCKKENNELLQDKTAEDTGITNSGIGDNSYEWSQMTVPTVPGSPNNDPTDANKIIQVNGNTFCLMGGALLTVYKLNNSTKKWEVYNDDVPGHNMFADFGAGVQYLFSYGTMMYIGLGTGPYDYGRYFYGRNPITRETVELAQFPGTPVSEATTFVIGNKGYLLGGKDINYNLVNQVWEYNFSTNHWTNKGNSPLGARAGATAIVIDNKAYIGLGYSELVLNGTHIRLMKNDWGLFNPTTPVASLVRADLPGAKRTSARTFVLNGNVYVCFGHNDINVFKDLWKYNPSSNTWVQEQSWPGSVNSNYGGNIGVFAQGNAAYVVKGALGQFWRYSNQPLIIIL